MIGQNEKMRDAHPSLHRTHNTNTYVRTMTNPYFVPAGRDYAPRSQGRPGMVKHVILEPINWMALQMRRLGYAVRRIRARLG